MEGIAIFVNIVIISKQHTVKIELLKHRKNFPLLFLLRCPTCFNMLDFFCRFWIASEKKLERERERERERETERQGASLAIKKRWFWTLNKAKLSLGTHLLFFFFSPYQLLILPT
jgi:hypothetical protein